MENRILPKALLACAIGLSSAVPAHGQPEASASRAEVKAATREAQKQHRLIPAGEGALHAGIPTAPSSKTRKQRKAETIEARNAGEIAPPGESGGLKASRVATSTKSSRTRAQRKTETLEAAKARELIPAGEGSNTSRK